MAAMTRPMAQQIFMDAVLTFVPTKMSFEEWQASYRMVFSGLGKAVPPNVHILTVEDWKQGVLVRVEHIFQKDEDQELSKPVVFSLKDIFSAYQINTVKEVTLGANLDIEKLDRLEWNVNDNNIWTEVEEMEEIDLETLLIQLKPMQIRTFMINVTPGN